MEAFFFKNKSALVFCFVLFFIQARMKYSVEEKTMITFTGELSHAPPLGISCI